VHERRLSTITDRLVARAFSLALDASWRLGDAAETLNHLSRGNQHALLRAAARVRRGLTQRSSALGERALATLTAASALAESSVSGPSSSTEGVAEEASA
jgi:hypothetical protein